MYRATASSASNDAMGYTDCNSCVSGWPSFSDISALDELRRHLEACAASSGTPANLAELDAWALHENPGTNFFRSVVHVEPFEMPLASDAASSTTATLDQAAALRQARGGNLPRFGTHEGVLQSEPTSTHRNHFNAHISGRLAHHKGYHPLRGVWCHLFLDPIMLEPGFELIGQLIGRSGYKMRNIFDATKTKVRVCGMGSGYKEKFPVRGRGSEWVQAPVPLMIALHGAEHGSADDFNTAFNMTKELLHDVSQRFEVFLRRQNHQKLDPTPDVRRFWIGEISEEATACLGALLDGML